MFLTMQWLKEKLFFEFQNLILDFKSLPGPLKIGQFN